MSKYEETLKSLQKYIEEEAKKAKESNIETVGVYKCEITKSEMKDHPRFFDMISVDFFDHTLKIFEPGFFIKGPPIAEIIITDLYDVEDVKKLMLHDIEKSQEKLKEIEKECEENPHLDKSNEIDILNDKVNVLTHGRQEITPVKIKANFEKTDGFLMRVIKEFFHNYHMDIDIS